MNIDTLNRHLASAIAQYNAHIDDVLKGADCGCEWRPGKNETACARYLRLHDRISGIERSIDSYYYRPDY